MDRTTLQGVSVVFHNEPCAAIFYSFPDTGNTCIDLETEKTGELFLTATIPYPRVTHPLDEVIIKDYSENEGIVEALQKAGIIGEFLFPSAAPFHYPVYQLLKNPLKN